jgi:hypothetical protein
MSFVDEALQFIFILFAIYPQQGLPNTAPTASRQPLTVRKKYVRRTIPSTRLPSSQVCGNPLHVKRPVPICSTWQRFGFFGSGTSGSFVQSSRSGMHPTNWKVAKGVILWKPGKPDYTRVKAYRVALLNCLGKIAEKVVASKLSDIVERRNLLHAGQFGSRTGRVSSPTRCAR